MAPMRARSRRPTKGRFLAFHSVLALRRSDRLDALEQLAGFLGRQDGRLAFSDDVFGAAHGVMGVTEREFERLARKAGKNIQGLRKATGWTQAELEQRSQVV